MSYCAVAYCYYAVSCDLQHQDEIFKSRATPRDTTVYVSIFTVHLSGFQELYRHFLRLSDGAIVEAFGDISGVTLLYNEVSTTIQEHVSESDNVLGASSLIKLRERKKNTARWKDFCARRKEDRGETVPFR
ncbi:hypothetical protein Y1Q_0015475 [Alligator mississippiensis]|uniref:Uncharacterized protein n=1 Tax=Alligator mississippiensis TaxID=8496 RepID=A0A151ND72_ALLMI|nr:hypothetical protein Y1Q_0015475 [Alligator mississippiensis]